ncbi:hypothetical protein AAFF_G00257250 [Aldrovandia affinis]|uniref:Uncharacterized protein n=1 Tax=Aldrovandia affinis TaxID=143900 RepID=A0AAD7WSZ0_9TELE|nr:hypothetical protein AAFF_G00257250 [Aldrovandia affinis]
MATLWAGHSAKGFLSSGDGDLFHRPKQKASGPPLFTRVSGDRHLSAALNVEHLVVFLLSPRELGLPSSLAKQAACECGGPIPQLSPRERSVGSKVRRRRRPREDRRVRPGGVPRASPRALPGEGRAALRGVCGSQGPAGEPALKKLSPTGSPGGEGA